MKRPLSLTALFSVFGLLALAACASQTSDEEDDATLGDDQEVNKAEGQACGGFAGLSCPLGSNCVLKGSFPDAPGKCSKPAAGTVGALCGGTNALKCKAGLTCKFVVSSGGSHFPPGAMGMPAPRKGTCQESDSKPSPGDEGGMCGGIAGFRCDPGLTCVMTGPMHPDKAGICKKSSGPPPGAVGMPKPNK